MKNLLVLSLLTAGAPALAAPVVKVCGTFQKGVAGSCITDFSSHELPGGTLYGVTEQGAGEPLLKLEHRWNGGKPDHLVRLRGGRLLVSEVKGGAGEGKSLEFEVRGPDGKAIAERSFDVRWQRGKMFAQEINPNEPLTPEAVPDPEKPVPPQTPTATEAPHPEPAPVASGFYRGFALRRGELHAAYQWSRRGKGSVSAVPYWNPEYRWREKLGVGARLGGTFWGDEQDKSFPALEADLHLSVPFHLSGHSFKLQPALGLHWWSGAGLGVSPGLVLDWRWRAMPFSVVASAHVWSQRDQGQRLVTVGLAREL